VGNDRNGYSTATLIAVAAAAVAVASLLYVVIKALRLPRYGLELPIVAFIAGLAVSAAGGEKLRKLFHAAGPWVFVDASLIIIGITANFSHLGDLGGSAGVLAAVNIAAGLAVGMIAAVRLGLDERFAATFVSGAAICGITAAITTGRAVRAEYPHLLIAMLLIAIVGAPFALAIGSYAAKTSAALGGALIGAVVDSTPVVRSIAEAIGGKTAEIALGVKLAQNALIPVAAIALAIVVSRLSGEEAVIPLSLVAMLVAATAFTFIRLDPGAVRRLETVRGGLLGAAMFMAGAATPLSTLKKPGVRIAIAVFVLVEVVNIIVAATLGPALLPG